MDEKWPASALFRTTGECPGSRLQQGRQDGGLTQRSWLVVGKDES